MFNITTALIINKLSISVYILSVYIINISIYYQYASLKTWDFLMVSVTKNIYIYCKPQIMIYLLQSRILMLY